MAHFWWQLPGPASFVRRIADELAEGRNVVLALPEHLPAELSRAIRDERFPDGEAGRWIRLTAASENQSSPARQVADIVLRQHPASVLVTATHLAQNDEHSGSVISVDGLTRDTWPVWRDFVEEYAHACRSRTVFERIVFIISLTGEPTLDIPANDVTLAVHQWYGVVEPIDQLLYASHLMRDCKIPRLQREIVLMVVAHLALWDPLVAEYLCRQPFKLVLDPISVLADFGAKREWTCLPDDAKTRWSCGMSDRFADVDQLHSAALAASSAAHAVDEIRRRIWSAQVGVLLPFVEIRRRELLEQLNGELVGPFRFDNGLVIENVLDLEIGQLEYQLSFRRDSPLRTVRLLKTIRNQLAHLEIVDAATLVDPAIGGNG